MDGTASPSPSGPNPVTINPRHTRNNRALERTWCARPKAGQLFVAPARRFFGGNRANRESGQAGRKILFRRSAFLRTPTYLCFRRAESAKERYPPKPPQSRVGWRSTRRLFRLE